MKLAQKRGWEMDKLRAVIELLAAGDALPLRHRHHSLGGEWKNFRDCHIGPDWLLIYRINGDELLLVRTGTHSDLF